MSIRKFLRAVQILVRKIQKLLLRSVRGLKNDLLRGVLRIKGRQERHSATAGFVLPTVAMVMLVVVLLTTAMVLRSFDRSKNASNFRVDRATLEATMPALERAKAKLDELIQDPTLPRATPTDDALLRVLESNSNKYTFGDETPLKLVVNVDGDGSIGEQDTSSGVEDRETLTTAWKFPVDTDNNGKYDTFTLYGIYFRTPPKTGEQFNRARNSLEARTPPLSGGKLSGQCPAANSTSAGLVGESGWYKIDDLLKKSFYVYAINVPITASDSSNPLPTANYEFYQGGTKGFAAVEYQQDRSRVPLANNAVVYEDDLEITPGAGLTLNGRVFTNSNLLMARQSNGNPIQLFLVSSKSSCYYKKETGEIQVGGNVGNGGVDDTTNGGAVRVDRFLGEGQNAGTSNFRSSNSTGDIDNTTNQTGGAAIAYNSEAYNQRIQALVDAALNRGSQLNANNQDDNANGVVDDPAERTSTTVDPKEVKDNVATRIQDAGVSSTSVEAYDIRREELEVYFRKRTRRVPFAEVANGSNALIRGASGTTVSGADVLEGPNASTVPTDANPLRPIREWRLPVDDSNNATSYTGFNLNLAQFPATDPQQLGGKEPRMGDRIAVGNNLPEIFYELVPGSTTDLQEANSQTVKDGSGVKYWLNSANNNDSTTARTRTTQAKQLADLGVADRDRFWELAAAEEPKNPTDNQGGLRVITGAGIYLPDDTAQIDSLATALPRQSNGSISLTAMLANTLNNRVWPDSMSMPLKADGTGARDEMIMDRSSDRSDSDLNDDRPYLKMRATAVYHWLGVNNDKRGVYTPVQGSTAPTYPKPSACVSSYYDPTNLTRAANRTGLPGNASLTPPFDAGTTNGSSHNGISYSWRDSSFGTTWAGKTYWQYLDYQSRLIYPSGRPVNALLQSAMAKINSNASGDPGSSSILRNSNNRLTLAEKTAIDTAFCALDILSAQATVDNSQVPHGVIKEIAFLDGREIKNVDNPADSRTYDLSIEERQPLEIRATRLDLDAMRRQTIGTSSTTQPQEYLLPNSGIVYVAREDALLDLSNSTGLSSTNPEGDLEARKLLSPTDFILDYTRRPSAVVLENGANLNRNNTNTYSSSQNGAHEKGLILATNQPVYIKGDFNLHQGGGNAQTEFTTNPGTDLTVASNFYGRTTPNTNFACRVGQFAACSTGDTWRAATVLADTVTLLSSNFQYGYRSDGDYDLRHNATDDLTPVAVADAPGLCATGSGCDFNLDGTFSSTLTIDEKSLLFDLNNDGDISDAIAENAIVQVPRGLVTRLERRRQGFFDNNFVTSNNFTDNDYADTVPPAALPSGAIRSSYFNNFVTPIQRRTAFPEYVMEICRRLPVSECTADDWVVGTTADPTIKASDIPRTTPATDLLSGTTSKPAINVQDRIYPRRVAFLRYPSSFSTPNALVLAYGSGSGAAGQYTPIPIGITGGNVSYHPYLNNVKIPLTDDHFAIGGTATDIPNTIPDSQDNTLWFRTSTSTTNPTGNLNFGKGTDKRLAYLRRLTRTTDPTGTTIGVGIDEQPLLIPIVQLQITKTDAPDDETNFTTLRGNNTTNNVHTTYWLQVADGTPADATITSNTYNLVIAAGDSPGRPTPAESNGSLGNFVRFIEDWEPNDVNTISNISGSFIQMRRSVYATAPYYSLLNYSSSSSTSGTYNRTDSAYSIFGYSQSYKSKNGLSIPYYMAPKRAWGFDVGLLTQLPDLFSQRFTLPPTQPPNEYFRQVAKDDPWVQALMCAAQPSQITRTGGLSTLTFIGGYPISGSGRDGQRAYYEKSGDPEYRYAVPPDQRPDCSASASGAIRQRT